MRKECKTILIINSLTKIAMGNIIFMLAIMIVNAIAIAIIYQFVKKIEKMDKIIFIVASVAIIYIAVTITYWISGFGIDKNVHEASKNLITFLFVPVNVILLVPLVATKYAKFKETEIEKSEFTKRLVIVSLVGIILLVGECFYFKNMQKNINNVANAIEENNNSKVKNEQTSNEDKLNTVDSNVETTNTQVNEKTNNVIIDKNVKQNNTVTNKIVNTESE